MSGGKLGDGLLLLATISAIVAREPRNRYLSVAMGCREGRVELLHLVPNKCELPRRRFMLIVGFDAQYPNIAHIELLRWSPSGRYKYVVTRSLNMDAHAP